MKYSLAFVLMALGVQVFAGCLNRADPRNPSVRADNLRPKHDGARLVVATYNVHGASADTLATALRAERALDADVLFLQEIEQQSAVSRATAEALASRLKLNYAYAPGYGLPRGGSHGVAILSRYRLRDIEIIELPRYSVVFNSARRVALAANVTIDGQTVRLYSVHLDNRLNPKDRVRQMRPVLLDARRQSVPVMIAGDFNTSPFCWLGHVVPVPCGVQDNRLEEAVKRHGFQTPVARSGPTSKWLGMRLDAIYTKGLVTKSFGVARSVRASDHLPLWAHLSL